MKRAVVCDSGTGVIKAGFAGDQEPAVVLPNILGRPLRSDAFLDGTQGVPGVLVGDDACSAQSMLQLSRPVQNGIVQDWDDMEVVWDYTFSRLGITPSEHQILQSEPALNPPRNRERLVETMFEKYGFAGINVSVQAIMALYSQGLTTGFVVDAGEGVTNLVPVTEGYLQPTLVEKTSLAGQHVTQQLMKLLMGQGQPLNSRTDLEPAREMKQKLCYVAYDLEAEKKLARETTLVDKTYTLPDGRALRVGAERFLAPEVLLNPVDNGHDGKGITELIFDTIKRSDVHVQKDLFAHIVLAGGTTMFPGLSSRLERDLRHMFIDRVLQGDRSRCHKFPIRVEDPPQRQYTVFLGSSILAAALEQETQSSWWITRAEYTEKGAEAVHRLIPTRLG